MKETCAHIFIPPESTIHPSFLTRRMVGGDLNELVFTFGGSDICANFGENQSRNATVRVLADGYTH